MAENSVFERIVEQYGSRLEKLTVGEKLEMLNFITEWLIVGERNPGLTTQECFENVAFGLLTKRSSEAVKMLNKASRRELLSFSHTVISQLSTP